MKSEKKTRRGRCMWLTPVLLALPAAAAMAFAAMKYETRIRELIQVAIKLVVTK